MIVLGILLILIAIAAGVVLFIATSTVTDAVQLDAFGVSASVLPIGLLIAGAAVLLLLWLGWAMVRGSIRRRARRRRETREREAQLRREAEEREARARREAEERVRTTEAPPTQRLATSERTDTAASRGDTGSSTTGDNRPTGSHDEGRGHRSVADRIMGRDGDRH